MPVHVKTTITIKLNNLFIEAIPWVNKMFRLTTVSYWTEGHHDMPEQKVVRHRQLSDQEQKDILEAIVNEWNLYRSQEKLDLSECCLVLDH